MDMDHTRLSDQSILITGGAGFIGSHLTNTLIIDNNVTVYDSLTTGSRTNISEEATLIEADIRDEQTLTQAFADVDIVFHEAALVSVGQSIETPGESHSTTATGTVNVLEAARKTDTRVVLASSAAIYGHPESTPIDEAHPLDPTSPYGLDKLTADHYTRLYNDLYGLDTVSLRYFNVYGPGQTSGDYAGVITVFIEQALNHDPITVHGDGDQTRDFVFIEDIVQANLLAAKTEHVGAAYNIGTGESITIRELAELIRDITNSDSEIVHTEPRDGDIEHSKADISKATEQLAFEPTVSLREGLKRTIEWYISS
jgi:UDP-glucose 4-epimerase